jgi:hypothetical protein
MEAPRADIDAIDRTASRANSCKMATRKFMEQDGLG